MAESHSDMAVTLKTSREPFGNTAPLGPSSTVILRGLTGFGPGAFHLFGRHLWWIQLFLYGKLKPLAEIA